MPAWVAGRGHRGTTRKCTSKEKGKPTEIGGVIYVESANKGGPRFQWTVTNRRIPLVFLHDVNGFYGGARLGVRGIIRAGAKMVNAVSNVGVPKISVILGGSYGAGHYGHVRQGLRAKVSVRRGPRPSHSVMGGDQAANTLLGTSGSPSSRSRAKSITEAEKKAALDEIKKRYRTPRNQIRGRARSGSMPSSRPKRPGEAHPGRSTWAGHNPEVPPLGVGVFQT